MRKAGTLDEPTINDTTATVDATRRFHGVDVRCHLPHPCRAGQDPAANRRVDRRAAGRRTGSDPEAEGEEHR